MSNGVYPGFIVEDQRIRMIMDMLRVETEIAVRLLPKVMADVATLGRQIQTHKVTIHAIGISPDDSPTVMARKILQYVLLEKRELIDNIGANRRK